MSYDSWDFDPAPAPIAEVDTWDTWDTGGSPDLPEPSPSFGSNGKDFGGKGSFGEPMPNFDGFKGGFGKGPNDFGKGPNAFGKGIDSVGDMGKGCFDMGKGCFDVGQNMNFASGPGDFGPGFGKGSPDFMKGGPDFGKGFTDLGKGLSDVGKGLDLGKGFDFGKGLDDFSKGCGKDFSKGKGNFGFKGQEPGNFGLKGAFGKNDFSDMGPGGFTPMGEPLGFANQGFQPANGSFGGKGMMVAPLGASAKSQASGQFVPAPQMLLQPMNKGMTVTQKGACKGLLAMKGLAPGFKGAPVGPGFQPMGGAVVVPPPPPGALAPFMQAGMAPPPPLMEAATVPVVDDSTSLMAIAEKKPRLVLLLTRLAPDLKSEHLHQILDQCGDVQGFRRARDPNGKPLSFGFAQFADPEAAWKAHTCISKLVLGGLEIKILIEEQTEVIIQQWRNAQQAALNVTSNEELEWELERKSVSCKAAVDAKVEELYGASKGGGAASKRREELRKKEQARVLRVRKRKAWREAEFAKELGQVESLQKRLRMEERERDGIDRKKEALSAPKVRAESELMVAKKEELNESGNPVEAVGTLAVVANDSRILSDLVDRIQSESRERIYKMDLDVSHLRNEKVFEKKLRPWLDRKLDICMGGPQSDLVEYVLRRVNAETSADALTSDLQRYLDDNAEGLVDRMWRMMIFELMRSGHLMDARKR